MKIFNKYERSTIHIRPQLLLHILNMKRLGCIAIATATEYHSDARLS